MRCVHGVSLRTKKLLRPRIQTEVLLPQVTQSGRIHGYEWIDDGTHKLYRLPLLTEPTMTAFVYFMGNRPAIP